MNIQKMDDHLTDKGKLYADETLNEIVRVLHRIRDFEQVYNVCEGTFEMSEGTFNVRAEFDVINRFAIRDFSRRNITITTDVDTSVSPAVISSQKIFRHTVMNLVIGSAADCRDTEISLSAAAVDEQLVVDVVNQIC
jgi:hypothetical protein